MTLQLAHASGFSMNQPLPTDNYEASAALFHAAIELYLPNRAQAPLKILDFGAGRGYLVEQLRNLAYDARGCDVDSHWLKNPNLSPEFFRKINLSPYGLPYENETFDVVVSTSVLEHAQNKREFFSEIHRVLKPGGISMHILPGKWYLPTEPHIFVPLVNYMWPHCPRWWLNLFAWLGTRNSKQQGKTWREVSESNAHYCKHGLSYISKRAYRKLSMEIFGNFSSPSAFYVQHSYGGVAKLLRRLPCKGFTGWLAGAFRMYFIVQRK